MQRDLRSSDRAADGHPRLVLSADGSADADSAAAGGVQEEFPLRTDRATLIGGDATADVRLPGLGQRHAEVRRTQEGEFELVALDPVAPSTVNGQPVTRSLLRTGDRLQLGDWLLSFARDEVAEGGTGHGRQGGESLG